MSTPDPARLAQIRARSRRLAAIALDVSPGDNCVVTDLVESASDVRWLLERMEQPQEFECEVCTKPITAYPCILCEHEPDPWKKPDEQPQDDGDVRAVALLAAADDDEELDRAVSELIARFADRIEALEARDVKAEPGGGSL